MGHEPYHYHEPEVKPGSSLASRRIFFAQCSCGWSGPPRDSFADAEDDCVQHRIYNNQE